jgi:hypothetical protein
LQRPGDLDAMMVMLNVKNTNILPNTLHVMCTMS